MDGCAIFVLTERIWYMMHCTISFHCVWEKKLWSALMGTLLMKDTWCALWVTLFANKNTIMCSPGCPSSEEYMMQCPIGCRYVWENMRRVPFQWGKTSHSALQIEKHWMDGWIDRSAIKGALAEKKIHDALPFRVLLCARKHDEGVLPMGGYQPQCPIDASTCKETQWSARMGIIAAENTWCGAL